MPSTEIRNADKLIGHIVTTGPLEFTIPLTAAQREIAREMMQYGGGFFIESIRTESLANAEYSMVIRGVEVSEYVAVRDSAAGGE